MSLALVLPILLPLLTACVSFLVWRRPSLQRSLAGLGSLAHLGSAAALLGRVSTEGIQSAQMGGWPAPFGITFVADLLSAIMVALAAALGLCVTLYSFAAIDARREAFGYHPLSQLLLMGVCGAFLTGDVFNLYVWFEVMLMASFVLMALGGEEPQMEGAIKYVALNLIASALFLAAAGILYGMAGTLNMADLALKLRHPAAPELTLAVALLLMVAFGIKAALFPLFFWLPASYHTPPAAVSALFSGLLTKVGVYALVRTLTLIFPQHQDQLQPLILGVAAATMVTGVLGAVAQTDFRRLLSFHIISQIGYLVAALGLFTAASLAAGIYFTVHVAFAKAALFLVSGIVHRLYGSSDLKRLGGLYASHPGLAILFLIPALSLAGIPPLSGFFAKLALLQAGLAVGRYAIVATALAVSLLTLFSMIKIWGEVFWKAPATPPARSPSPRLLYVPVALISALLAAIGLHPEPLFSLASAAAEQLLDPRPYIDAVLGGSR